MANANKLSLDRVYQAAFTLKEVARMTDLIYSPHFSGKNQVYLKTENLQVTGSFKLRGAYFKISKLNEDEKKAGIVACSAGNHARRHAAQFQSRRQSADDPELRRITLFRKRDPVFEPLANMRGRHA